jgi:hypothetical protein
MLDRVGSFGIGGNICRFKLFYQRSLPAGLHELRSESGFGHGERPVVVIELRSSPVRVERSALSVRGSRLEPRVRVR